MKLLKNILWQLSALLTIVTLIVIVNVNKNTEEVVLKSATENTSPAKHESAFSKKNQDNSIAKEFNNTQTKSLDSLQKNSRQIILESGAASNWRGTFGSAISAKKVRLGSSLHDNKPFSKNDEISINIDSQTTIHATVVDSFININDTVSTTAHINGTKWGRIFLSTTNGVVSGRVRIPSENKIFAIEYNIADNSQYLLELDPELAEPEEGDDMVEIPETQADIQESSNNLTKEQQVLPSESHEDENWEVIDIMVVYTDDVLSELGSVEKVNNMIALGAAYANDAYRNSDIHMHWNVALSYKINYNETGNQLTDLSWVKDDSSIATKRDECGGDFVQLITTGAGGQAYVIPVTYGYSSDAFSLVGSSSYISYVPAHEIGHNMGCSHAADQTTEPGPTSWQIDYEGFGDCAAGHHWHTNGNSDIDGHSSVMAYTASKYFDNHAGGHTRVGLFSTPLKTHNGETTGVVDLADNSKVIQTLRSIYSGYKSTPGDENSITVLSPDQNSSLKSGEQFAIVWSSKGVNSNVKIELYKDGIFNRTISLNTINDRIFTWDIPSDISGTGYTIKISDSNQTITGTTENSFTIFNPFYYEPMDANPGYTTSGDWQYGIPQGGNGTPKAPYSGNTIYGTDLGGTSYYYDWSDHLLTSKAIDCSLFTNCSLSFYKTLSLASGDTAKVEISNGNGQWTPLYNSGGGQIYSVDWEKHTYDISSIADKKSTIYIRWSIITNGDGGIWGGWGLDDVQIVGLEYIPEYTITANSTAGGSVNPESQTVSQGDSSAEITASPETGYHFSGWSGDSSSSENPLSLTNVTSAKNVTANFSINQYTVQFDLGTYGTRTGGGELLQTINHGNTATPPTVSCSENWELSKWSVNFSVVTSSLIVKAEYIPEDSDNDGISNLDEIDLGYDPYSFTIILESGWNMIRIPLTIIPENIDTTLSGNIWQWDHSQGVYELTINQQDLDEAFWVHHEGEAKKVEFSGVELQLNDIPIATGWTMIGVDEALPISDSPDILAIWSWNAKLQIYNQHQATDTLGTGHAYWIFTNKATKLIKNNDSYSTKK